MSAEVWEPPFEPNGSAATYRNEYLSVSRLKLYLECPRAFFWRYVRPLPPEYRFLDPDAPSIFGSATHATLEAIYAWIVREEYEGTFPRERILPEWQAAFESAGLTGVAEYQEGLRILRDYAEKHPRVEHWSILGIEDEFLLDLGQGFRLKGFIDRIDRTGDNELTCVDYKTNRRYYTKADLAADVQMPAYGLAILARFPWVKTIRYVFHMVRLGAEQRTERTRAQLDDARGYLVQIGKRTESDTTWKAKINPNCAYCEFRGQCGDYQKAVHKRHPQAFRSENLGDVIDEWKTVERVAKAAYARARELETLVRTALEKEPLVHHGQHRYELVTKHETRYRVRILAEILGRYGVPRGLLADKTTISKEKVKDLVGELAARMTESDHLLMKNEIEALALETVPAGTQVVAMKA